MYTLKTFGLMVLLCLIAVNAEDKASPATLAQIELITNSIDNKIDACNNFYSFACGDWEHMETSYDENSSNGFIANANYMAAVEKMLISEEVTKKENQSFKEKLGTFYKSCVNAEKYLFFDKIKPAHNLEWPLVAELEGKPEVDVTQSNIIELMANLFGYGLNNFLLNHNVERRYNGSVFVTLDVPQEEENIVLAIVSTLLEVTSDDDKHKEWVNKYKEQIAETHKYWLSIYKEYKEQENIESDLYSYDQIEKLYPAVAKFLELLLPNTLRADDFVELKNLNYIKFLIAKKWGTQENREVVNYSMAVFLHYLFTQYEGDCNEVTKLQMNLAVNYRFGQQNFNEEKKNTFQNLVENIRKTLIEQVEKNSMDLTEDQVWAIKDKLASITVVAGNVPPTADDNMLEEFYKTLPDMDENDFTQNVLWTLRHKFWTRFNCPKNMECIEDVGYKTYHNAEKELIVVNWAFMEPAFYDNTFDPVLTASVMGSILAHEFAQFILPQNLTSDIQSNLNIKSSSECTNKQFSTNYQSLLQADLLGVQTAFDYYKKNYKGELDFTQKSWQQVFFLNYAQYFCQWTPMFDKPPYQHETRSNYVAMNIPEYSAAFNCPASSTMNSKEKCLLY